MPTYEFRCPKGHEFEKFYRSIGSAPSEVHCPECGALAERQLSGGAGLVFKGSGFYITDYGKDGKKDLRTAAPVKSDSASSDSSAAKSTDSASAGSSKSGDTKSSDSKSSAGSDSKTSSSTKSGSSESKPSSTAAKKKDAK